MGDERLPERRVGVEFELKGAPLDRLQEHFKHLYGRRNEIFLPGRVSCIDFLNVATGDLQDAIRKDSELEHLAAMFARIPSRIFCIAHGINNVSVAKAMIEKYPLEGCAYCHGYPCQCGERRPEVTLVEWHPDAEQVGWSLMNWQLHLDNLYGEANRKKGIENILNRLFKEVSELFNLEYSIGRSDKSMDEIEHEYALELADGLVWTIAGANLCNVDLEKTVLDRYARGCRKCGWNPCSCTHFSFEQIRA
jgi:NTP pyrophosphatase (non-canonical NTP hydrolase)